MGYDRTAPKRPETMTLNEDLVRQARELTSNLSETVERVLENFVEDSEARGTEQAHRIAAHIAASDAFVKRHGSLADEFHDL